MLSKELLEKTVAEAIDITRNQYAKTDSVYKMERKRQIRGCIEISGCCM